MKKLLFLILTLLFCSANNYAEDVQVKGLKSTKDLIKGVNKDNHQINLNESTSDCVIKDQIYVYKIGDAKAAAKRDYIEESIKLYGIPDGIGPIFPKKSALIHQVNNLNKVVIWPTYRCGKDLTLEKAKAYAEAYNSEIDSLLKR